MAIDIDDLTRARLPSKSNAHWLRAQVARHVTLIVSEFRFTWGS